MATNFTAPNYSEFFKAFGDFKTPNFDFDTLFAAQRRNIEALTTANQVFAEGIQAVSRRQAEAVRTNVEGFIKASKDALTGTSPDVNVAKQADYAKNMFETSLAHLREVAETVTKSSYEAFDVLNRRAAEQFDEITSATATKKRKA